jgi:NADPH-dependent glutamate synthase beta subunit-like oxidoreductase/Pyruvate/2-oxoacid:ferredoxin oxidoreductase delta subunit
MKAGMKDNEIPHSAEPTEQRPHRIPPQPAQLEKLPPCRANCPSGTDIRGWITTIAQREKLGLSDGEAYRLAWQKIVEVNPFPAVMGRVCPHPCEAGCNRADKDGAIAVNQLERFIGDWALEQGLQLQVPETDRKLESIGVIGAGPAGLSFAYQMVRRGYQVTVYERYPKAGGMLRYGIPVYRLPEDVLDAEIDRILELGVELHLNTRIGRDISPGELRERHKSLFLGIGAHKGRLLGVLGEAGPGVWTGTDYLSRVNQGEDIDLGARVAVVGGGDTAIDAARAARRSGAEVAVLDRRTREEMPAIDSEVEEAMQEGIRIEYLVSPVSIKRGEPELQTVTVRRMELGLPDESGRRRPVPIQGSDYDIPVDTVISAISQEPDWDNLTGLHPGDGGDRAQADAWGHVDEQVWAGGDVLTLGIASSAIARGRLAAEAVHARLRGLPSPELTRPDPIGTPAVKLDYYPPKARLTPSQLPPEQWLKTPNAEIHTGIQEEQFRAEVSRCLSCGQCFGCEHCWMYCAHTCFTRLEEVRSGAYFFVTLDQCQSCGKCVDVCPCGFLQVRSP